MFLAWKQISANSQRWNVELIKTQRHTGDPSNYHDKGEDQQSDLHAGSYCDTNGEVHLIFNGHRDSSSMLCGVAHDGEENQSYEGL